MTKVSDYIIRVAMIKKFNYKDIEWIDVESPTKSDITDLSKEYNIELIAGELREPSLRPKVDSFDDVILLILHFPIFDKKHKKVRVREVDFILGKKFIITAHYEPVAPLHEMPDIFSFEKTLSESAKRNLHSGYLFYAIVRHIYDSLEEELLYINDHLEKIEDEIFKGHEQEMVASISVVGRQLIDFRRAIKAHGEILSSFEKVGGKFFGVHFLHYVSFISGDYYRIWNLAEGSKDILHELRTTNDSLLTTKTNNTMKYLTVMAFVTFPLSLLAGIFGMNTTFIPIVGHKYDFWLIVGMMATITTGFFAFFKYKKWL